MKVIKRSGQEVEWNVEKIKLAINKANNSVDSIYRLSDEDISDIANNIEAECFSYNRPIQVETIQDMVENHIMEKHAFQVARNYITYRYQRALIRKGNSIDDNIRTLLDGTNAVLDEENSNKKPSLLSVQRDYMAGEISKDYSRRHLLPEDIMKAHDEGLIHIHDLDYYIQRSTNCCLVNLEDMLQNGTVISEVMIDTPKSFSTACNIATQVVAQVASSQFGGQSITLSHLAPFVDVSRKKIRALVKEEFEESHIEYTEEQLEIIVESRVKEEINRGVQMIQYQVVTLMTTNGQAPFITVFMYLNEVEDKQTKHDLALVIEEVLNQRILGIKNEKGVYITPAFPKLIYVLEEDNIHEDSEYYYLTKLAAKCTAKRMVPDYISEKIMKQLKIDKTHTGQCYPVMGCVDGKSVIDYNIRGERFVEAFERTWERMASIYEVKTQPNGTDLYIDTPDVSIWDNKEGRYVKQHRIIRNLQDKWLKIGFSGGRHLEVTDDHPFEIINKGVVLAKDIEIGDSTYAMKFADEICQVDSIENFSIPKYSYDVTTESEHFMVNAVYSHNCRSALTPDRTTENISKCNNWNPEKGKYYGRFNQGVTTINLVDIACSSNGDEELFWKIFDERLEICHRALLYRHKKLLGTPSDIAPILWQNGAIARLEKGEPIDKLLVGGYSTISLGYAGLYECVKYMKGVSHSDEEVGMPFALKIMRHLNNACARWKYDSNIDYSLYGTPLESTTYKFAKCLQERFGIIEDVTDHNYITNSYHIPVREEINAFDKLRIESKFQELSPGGAISYVEVPNMQNNIESVLDIIKFIYDNIMYAELNTKSDYCMECGYDGEIKIVEESGKLLWECPQCKNRNQDTMNVARRSCGYIGSQFWNQGRTQEIRDRVLHVSKNTFDGDFKSYHGKSLLDKVKETIHNKEKHD